MVACLGINANLVEVAGSQDLACSACSIIARSWTIKAKIMARTAAKEGTKIDGPMFNRAAHAAGEKMFQKEWFVRTVEGKEVFVKGSVLPEHMKEGLERKGYDFSKDGVKLMQSSLDWLRRNKSWDLENLFSEVGRKKFSGRIVTNLICQEFCVNETEKKTEKKEEEV